MRTLIAVVLLIALLAGPTWAASSLYMTSDLTDTLYEVDLSSQTTSAVGSLGGGTSFSGLAYDGSQMWLSDVAINGWATTTVDLDSGLATFVGSQNTANVHALAYHDGVLYGLEVSREQLGIVNRATGAWTAIPGAASLPTGTSFRGADFDDATGVLYVLSSGGIGSELYTLDPSTGASSLVGSLGVAMGYTLGLAWNPDDGQLYAVGNDPQQGVYRVDKTTGAATFLFSHGIDKADALEFVPSGDGHVVPEPLTMGAISAGLIGLGGYIRRRRTA